jgi:mannose-1-phosphate guanylyltransferase
MKNKPASTVPRFVVILAGGRGERFWPMSRAATPKHLLALLGKQSLLQAAVERAAALVPLANILIITTEAQAAAVRRQAPRLPKENVLVEPCGRDTCAAVALSAAVVGQRSTNAVMALVPADHVIPETRGYLNILEDAFDLASRGQVIITLGIRPTEPATGYGYIRTGVELPSPHGRKPYKTRFFKAEQFVEKPPYDRALEYVNSGAYRWNAGMFVWSFVTITESLGKHAPELAAACRRWFDAAGTPKLAKVLSQEYPGLERISIDFAVLEQAQNVVVAAADFAWDDLGSWTALGRHLKADAAGNCALADFVHVDAARNIVVDARVKHRTPIALVGLRDAIVVQTDDATLVAHKSQAQKVKELVAKLAAEKRYAALL